MENVTIRFNTLPSLLSYVAKHPYHYHNISFEDDYMGKFWSVTSSTTENPRIIAPGSYYLHNLNQVIHSFLEDLPDHWTVTINFVHLADPDYTAVEFHRPT